jgi:hypothetical protein
VAAPLEYGIAHSPIYVWWWGTLKRGEYTVVSKKTLEIFFNKTPKWNEVVHVVQFNRRNFPSAQFVTKD